MRSKAVNFRPGGFNIPRKTCLLKGDIDITPLIDCVFLLLIFFMLSSSFVKPAGIIVNLPKTATAEVLREEKFVIVITSDNIIRLEEEVVTIDDLKEVLAQRKQKIDSLLIKADEESSLGKIIEVWDMCRELGIEKLNIATLQTRID